MNISKWGLDAVLATNLSGVPLFEGLLSRVNLETDESGNVLPHQIDNIKTFIKVALRLSVKTCGSGPSKLRQALLSLLEYGTQESSNHMRSFLESPESKMPLVITESTDGYAQIARAVSPFVEHESGYAESGALDEARALIRSVVQDFSEPQHTIH